MAETALALELAHALEKHPDLPVFACSDALDHPTSDGWWSIDSIVKSDGGMLVLFITKLPSH